MLSQFRLNFSHRHRQPIIYPVIRQIVESGCKNFGARSFMAGFTIESARPMGACLVRSAVHQREDPCLFSRVIERMKPPDFIETTNGVEGVEKTGVVCRKLACL